MQYVGNFLNTARVTVDYTSGRVLFDYPKKGHILEDMAIAYTLFLFVCIPFYTTVRINGVELLHDQLLSIVVVLLTPLVPTLIVFGFFREQFAKWFSKTMYSLSKWGGYYRYTTTSLPTNTFEIPLFRNKGLDYIFKGDFSKYIDKIEIREHPFQAVWAGEAHPNTMLWKATFTFKEIPQKGEMTLEFI